MQYLIDTQIFIWLMEQSPSLNPKVMPILNNPDSDLRLSIASIWEIGIKCGIGKLTFPEPLEETLQHQLELNRIELLPITFTHALRVRQLPLYHRDPFDRLIIAQALAENLPVVSSDGNFDRYGIERIW
jgi:PIN domain nuclease of toxin-antitoxin system